MVVTSEALGTCERLAQGRYSAMRRPGVEPATCWLQVQRPKHYTTEPHKGLNAGSHEQLQWVWQIYVVMVSVHYAADSNQRSMTIDTVININDQWTLTQWSISMINDSQPWSLHTTKHTYVCTLPTNDHLLYLNLLTYLHYPHQSHSTPTHLSTLRPFYTPPHSNEHFKLCELP